MKNKSEEIVLRDWEKGENSEYQERIIAKRKGNNVLVFREVKGYSSIFQSKIWKFPIGDNIPIKWATIIHEAWGKKKEITEKEIQKLLEDLSDFDWCGVEDEPYIQEYLTTWLSKLGIEVKPKGGKK